MTDAKPFTACTDTDGNVRDDFDLTPLQRAFCDRYMELMGEGITRGLKKQAALEAGYSELHAPNAAFKNLRHPSCVAYIAGQMSAATTKVPVDRSYVLFKALQVVERAEANGFVFEPPRNHAVAFVFKFHGALFAAENDLGVVRHWSRNPCHSGSFPTTARKVQPSISSGVSLADCRRIMPVSKCAGNSRSVKRWPAVTSSTA